MIAILILAASILIVALLIGTIAAKLQTRRYAAFATQHTATRIAGHYPLSFTDLYL